MIDNNFWHWVLITLLEEIIRSVFPYFPRHQYWGLPGLIGGYAVEMMAISFVFLGSFINLWNFFRVMLIIAALEVWRSKGKILKMLAVLRYLI